MAPAIMTVMFSEFADGSSEIGRIEGSSALRVGWFTAKNDCWIANSPNRIHGFVLPSAACTQKPALETMRPTVVMTNRVRRSM
ncbi:hypothetical protein GCM10025862_24260 [Arsenicicoccus piscis]|uniref:Uncharacterized protein n=1 Tax=Arsenicicoccus piscis TaxID=673954 RepID=A0ABQ6HQD8_9MICO|nr:hypothetical protein GCM10025862_24260 [Arsenicicoccus piscis]